MAYFVAPPAPSPVVAERSNFAISKSAFDLPRRTVWCTDGNSALYAVRLTNAAAANRLRVRVRLSGKRDRALVVGRIAGDGTS